MKSLREFPLKIVDRTFLLKEINGKRRGQIDDLFDRARVLAKKLDETSDLEERRALRQEKKEIDNETYRVFLIPLDPKERTPDEWFDENLTEGYFTHVVCELQGGLNRYENMAALGKSIKEKLSEEPAAAETNGLSAGLISVGQ